MTSPAYAAPAPAQPPPIPPEIDRWNWGAFLLHWIWGVGNRTYVAFLVFVPFFGIPIMPFVLGAKGSVWAWRNQAWASIAEFERVQRKWAFWGVMAWLGVMLGSALFTAGLFALIVSILSSSDAYRLGVERVAGDRRVVARLGSPVTAGWPMGSIRVDTAQGEAAFGFSVSGPRASGYAELEATKAFSTWTLRRLRLKVEGDAEPIDLLDDRRTRLQHGGRGSAAAMP